jgi:endoglucanase
MRKLIAFVFFVIGLTMISYALYRSSSRSQKIVTFSNYSLLNGSWTKYKEVYMGPDGRVFDATQNNITTSEGQSYALLRAVWVDDKETFDKVWKWTRENLKTEKSNLFGWRWGKRPDSSYGFLNDADKNSASDADSDIALALILADRRWKNAQYTEDAKKILKDLFEKSTAVIAKKRYLIAGEWAHDDTHIIVNPSYFSPYAWRIFQTIDTSHNWNSLIDPAYELLQKSSFDPLGSQKAVGLPPNWVQIKKDGSLSKTDIANLTTDYSFDAMRVPWRISLDYIWFHEPRAKEYLTTSFEFLRNEYTSHSLLYSSYNHNGEPLTNYENASMYGTALGYFIVTDKPLADKIYQDKILKLYSTKDDSFSTKMPYYEQNWLWFGAAMYNNYLLDFAPQK